ncbi:Rv3235 family protein [Allonocardiopsis opalescens]|uniref:3-hydroxyacyl-CoA dehydrogenase n=1 Tax=Allonocardiopsis opalescens TaxID=1144618 RepID=A0A2T0QC45_9ACTN|nr:Rv3235 family protein [Allonocardiopsis opalescens]PRY01524.1 hypothetical protein CLV72_101106 [Allonocardiopsis opalescens]
MTGTLALDFGGGAPPDGAARLRRVAGRRPGELPPARFAQAIAEVLAGQRPPEQLTGRISAQAYRRVAARIGIYRARTRPRLRSTQFHVIKPGTAEMTAVIDCGERTRALALRLERVDGRWICAAVETD